MIEIEKNQEDIFNDTAKKGAANILHHFDRIHDKLFTFNNILIAGYFASSKINPTISIKYLVIPFLNLAFLIYLEYRMMELSRSESNVLTIPFNDLEKKLFKKYSKVTLFSFLSILSTSVVTLLFLLLIFK